jgi:hypothetical protein
LVPQIILASSQDSLERGYCDDVISRKLVQGSEIGDRSEGHVHASSILSLYDQARHSIYFRSLYSLCRLLQRSLDIRRILDFSPLRSGQFHEPVTIRLLTFPGPAAGRRAVEKGDVLGRSRVGDTA